MGSNGAKPNISTKLAEFLSKNTHLRKTHSMLNQIENKCEEEEKHDDEDDEGVEDDDDHGEKRIQKKKKKRTWAFFFKNRLSSKIKRAFSKINPRPSSSSNNNGDDVKESKRKSVKGTRSTNESESCGEGKKMVMNRSLSLKKGVVVKKKKKKKKVKEMERKKSIMRRNGSDDVEEDEFWKKKILMGIRCKPINSSPDSLYN